MPVDAGDGQERDQFLALSDYHGGVYVRAGLRRVMDYLSNSPGADRLTGAIRMNGILDGFLVGLALLASAGYAAVSLGPRSLRRRILGVLSHAAARAPVFLGLGRAAQRLAAASAAKTQGACGGCDNCG